MHPCKDCDSRERVKKSGKTIWNISLQLTDDMVQPFTKKELIELVRDIARSTSGLKVSKVKVEKVSK